MFLRPHHFQQAENYLEGYMRNWGQAHSGCFWGFLTLDLDQTLLRRGKIALNAASGIMPDGTPFRFAGAQQAPAPLTIAENKTGENVVLALPTYRAGREDVIFQEARRRWRAIWLTRMKSTISTPSRWAARRCSLAACACG